MAHTRGIVVYIAMMLTVLILWLRLKRRPVSVLVVIIVSIVMFALDFHLSAYFNTAIYSIDGPLHNTLDTSPLRNYLDVFSFETIKSMIALTSSWLFTLFSTTTGLVVVGLFASCFIFFSSILKPTATTANERVVGIFSFFLFAGFFLSGILFFKRTYYNLVSGILTSRVDRLLYDRYSMCGLGPIVLVGVYALSQGSRFFHPNYKKILTAFCVFVLSFFFWKGFPQAVRYPGYLYNTVSLNTFSSISDPWTIMWGAYYSRISLLLAFLFGSIGFTGILYHLGKKLSANRLACLLAVIAAAQSFLIFVNFQKIRLATDRIVTDTSAPVIELFDSVSDITAAFPNVVKYGSDVVRIQYYQPQLPTLHLVSSQHLPSIGDNYFVISSRETANELFHSGMELYCFAEYDYEHPSFDGVYICGKNLKEAVESTGHLLYQYTGN